MNSAIKDIKIDSGYYFIKDFEFENRPQLIMGKNYWELKNSEQSYFKLRGYLHKEGDNIMLVPHGYNVLSPKQYKLFDFSESKGAYWKFVYNVKRNGYLMGDSIILSNIRLDKQHGKIFTYSLFPYVSNEHSKLTKYYDSAFLLEVNEDIGIISISALDPKRVTVRYHAVLFPRQKFIQNQTSLLDL